MEEDIVDSDDSFRPTSAASPEVTADDDSDDDDGVVYGSDSDDEVVYGNHSDSDDNVVNENHSDVPTGDSDDDVVHANTTEDDAHGSDSDDDVVHGSHNGDVVHSNPRDDDVVHSTDNDDDVVEGSDNEKTPVAAHENTIQNTSLYRDIVQSSSDDDDDDDFPKASVIKKSNVINDSLSIVELSSDEDNPPVALKQPSIKSFMISSGPPKVEEKVQNSPKMVVSMAQYQDQVKKVASIEADLSRAKNALRVIKLENLPDKGKSIVDKERALNRLLDEQRKLLANMSVDAPEKPGTARDKIEVAWDQIEAGVDAVAPRTFGKKGVAQFNMEKQLAVDTLDSLHKSLETCPGENDFAEDPKGLKVDLMPHQKRALAWLLWRERQKPSGGLLADDMGLGKTLTMISLILKSNELEYDETDKENYRDKYPGGTLVVCPASLLNQWSGEIERRCKRGLLDVEVYHGAKRETKARRLGRHDVVITTYTLALNENTKNGALYGVRWRRIILDEAHQIRNHKSQTSEAIFRLSGKSRWALTGTPVHNKELDMYAIFKFLRCSPFDDLRVWKHWVADKSTGGDTRLHAVISSLMLRRTKVELMEKGTLKDMPSRTSEVLTVALQSDEMNVYQKVLIFSVTLFAQFLHQRAEKNQDSINYKFTGAPPDPNGEYSKMRKKLLKLNRVKEVSQHEILVLLLRLRQICCHPSLITQMLQPDEALGDVDDEDELGQNLLDQLNQLKIQDDDGGDHTDVGTEAVALKEASKGYLNASNPVFLRDRRSSKLDALINLLKSKLSGDDKAIIVSQWTSFLDLVAIQLDNEGIPYESLNGKIPVQKRSPIVNNFNDPNSNTKVLLLSLTAGGVGLNLVGANHLFLLDFHWNPQLETQAQDRIYRVGQKKTVYVYKFMAVDTIEERIRALQEKKLDIADSMLTGSKRVGSSKLTLQDLKMLFDFK